MPFPRFTPEGVLPPYRGSIGPGDTPHQMSPYKVSAVEMVTKLGFSEKRKSILRGWLDHRAALRAIGFDRGFQWCDGSFVEDKHPKDLDVVSFLCRPAGVDSDSNFGDVMATHRALLERNSVKQQFGIDFFVVDLDGNPETVVRMTRYWFGLFSHRREDELWKGMLEVNLHDERIDHDAIRMLGAVPRVQV